MSETLDTTTGSAKRPTFLTVLCILTFIGSGLGLLGGILGLVGTSALSYFSPQGTMLVQIIGLAASALCLFGAIKMWGLYKQGFMMYLLGALLSIVGSIVSAMTIGSAMNEVMSGIEGSDQLGAEFNTAMQSAASAAAWSGAIFAIIINVLFVILYNVNRKHLVK